MLRKQVLLSMVVLFLLCSLAPALHAQEWVFLGESHVDGQVDHDKIEVGKARGRYHALQIRVRVAPIRFERVVGTTETGLQRHCIYAKSYVKAIKLVRSGLPEESAS